MRANRRDAAARMADKVWGVMCLGGMAGSVGAIMGASAA